MQNMDNSQVRNLLVSGPDVHGLSTSPANLVQAKDARKVGIVKYLTANRLPMYSMRLNILFKNFEVGR
jgi:hypothetical protein